jgi:hypothetical protein
MVPGHGSEKALLHTRAAEKRNRNFGPPFCTRFDVRPAIAILRVKMEERHAFEIENSVRTLRDARQLPQLTKHVLEVQKILAASVSHADTKIVGSARYDAALSDRLGKCVYTILPEN